MSGMRPEGVPTGEAAEGGSADRRRWWGQMRPEGVPTAEAAGAATRPPGRRRRHPSARPPAPPPVRQAAGAATRPPGPRRGARESAAVRALQPTARLSAVSHPVLGLPPTDMRAGFPAAAERICAERARLGARTLEALAARDPTLGQRLGEAGLRALLRDTEVYLERVARAVASNDPGQLREWAEWVVPVYRRRRVPLDDLVGLGEAVREVLGAVLGPDERVPADEAITEAKAVFRWHRRIAGDARRRNRLLAAIYRGA